MWTVFDYMYRDGGNFKAFGTIVLKGRLSQADRQVIKDRLDGGECFVAEQVGVPPLYEQLYRWSNGATRSDHCWHEFVQFREVKMAPDGHSHALEASALVERFRSVAEWDCSLSPHFELGC
jgi:hypothetical protein